MLYANGPIPLYQQLFTQLRREIETQSLPVGRRLPSERELAAAHGISRLTARRALQLLQQAGYVDAQQGRGSFVVSAQARNEHRLAGFTELARKQGLVASSIVLQRTVIACDAELAKHLEVSPLSEVIMVRRLRIADGKPTAIDTCYLPFDLCHRVLEFDLESASLYALLEHQLGFRLEHFEQSAQAVIADEEQLQLLALHHPAALLLLQRRTRNEKGRIVEYVEIVYCGEHCRVDLQQKAI